MKKQTVGIIGAIIAFLIGVGITFIICIGMELLLSPIMDFKTLVMLIGIVILVLSAIIGVMVDHVYKLIIKKNPKD